MSLKVTQLEKAILKKLIACRKVCPPATNSVSLVELMRWGWKSEERGNVKIAVKSLAKKQFLIGSGKNKYFGLNRLMISKIIELAY